MYIKNAAVQQTVYDILHYRHNSAESYRSTLGAGVATFIMFFYPIERLLNLSTMCIAVYFWSARDRLCCDYGDMFNF